MKTKTLLVQDLKDLPFSNGLIEELIRAARGGLFHDFQSNEPAPKQLLIQMLQAAGLDDLADAAREGRYD